jgi:SAM-dependent methyltransferase
MQFDTEKDPFINWREWWDKYDENNSVYKFESDKKYVLNLGCGGLSVSKTREAHLFTDYKEVTGDIDTGVNPDIVCDINDLTNIPEKSVDAVYLSHMLEHLDYFAVPNGIRQMLRILKPNGFIKLRVPNLKVLTEYLESGKINDTIYESNAGPVTALDILYGYRYSIKHNQNDFMRHKTGFTKEVFEAIAKDHNFDLKVTEDDLDLIVDIYKH